MFQRFKEFLMDTRVEMTKVSWPSRDELRASTIVVIVSALVITLFIGLVDQIFNVILRELIT